MQNDSGVASPKIWGAKNFWGKGKMFWVSANNTLLFGKTRLKAKNDYIF